LKHDRRFTVSLLKHEKRGRLLVGRRKGPLPPAHAPGRGGHVGRERSAALPPWPWGRVVARENGGVNGGTQKSHESRADPPVDSRRGWTGSSHGRPPFFNVPSEANSTEVLLRQRLSATWSCLPRGVKCLTCPSGPELEGRDLLTSPGFRPPPTRSAERLFRSPSPQQIWPPPRPGTWHHSSNVFQWTFQSGGIQVGAHGGAPPCRVANQASGRVLGKASAESMKYRNLAAPSPPLWGVGGGRWGRTE
jgi:hypothetical protein